LFLEQATPELETGSLGTARVFHALPPTRWSDALELRSNRLRNKAAEALKAGRKDAAARGAAYVAPIFMALAGSYKRQARLNDQARALRETSTPDIK
jgi:hypothetical protein